MAPEPEKCVIVLDGRLPSGVLANTAAILGVTLGARRPDVVGCPAADRDGQFHPGIIRFPIPVLRGDGALLRALRARLRGDPQFSGVTVAEFTTLAQGCTAYPDFIERMSRTPEEELCYTGLGLCGPKRTINRLTGNLPLLR